ncbi:MAG: hypothetical protein ACI9TV_003288 [Sulfurimonas sp.]
MPLLATSTSFVSGLLNPVKSFISKIRFLFLYEYNGEAELH